MRTSIFLTIAALGTACNSADSPPHTPDDDGEAPETSAIPFQGPSAVTVANDTAHPVPVETVGTTTIAGTVTIANTAAAPTPWIGGGQILIRAGETFGHEQFFTVPPDKYLVIEYVTLDVGVPDGQIAYQATLLGAESGAAELFRFPLQPVAAGESAAHDYFAAALATKINIRDAGVLVTVSRNDTTGVGVANVALSGYLVDN